MTVRNVERVRPVGDLSVSQLSLSELHRELQRRAEALRNQRDELLQKVESIERELEAIGSIDASGDSPASPRNGTEKKPKARSNSRPLKQLLAELLQERRLTTREVADAALEAGYVTTSKNFANSVGVVLYREEQFVKSDGKWGVSPSEARS